MEKTRKMYVTAEEAAEILGVSTGYAYKIIRGLNEELKEKGYRTICGKVPTKYFEEKFYGLTVTMQRGGSLCRQHETVRCGAVSFITKTGRE
ncbi:ICEBs1 excisionase [Clostridium porci]